MIALLGVTRQQVTDFAILKGCRLQACVGAIDYVRKHASDEMDGPGNGRCTKIDNSDNPRTGDLQRLMSQTVTGFVVEQDFAQHSAINGSLWAPLRAIVERVGIGPSRKIAWLSLGNCVDEFLVNRGWGGSLNTLRKK
jgi:hypothetical protein